jgi:hypothetical protein
MVKAIFENDEEGYITLNSSNLNEQEIRVPVTAEWDDTTPYRVACSVGDDSLSLQRYEGESENPDVMEDEGWEEVNTIVEFELNPDGPPESPPDEIDI